MREVQRDLRGQASEERVEITHDELVRVEGENA